MKHLPIRKSNVHAKPELPPLSDRYTDQVWGKQKIDTYCIVVLLAQVKLAVYCPSISQWSFKQLHMKWGSLKCFTAVFNNSFTQSLPLIIVSQKSALRRSTLQVCKKLGVEILLSVSTLEGASRKTLGIGSPLIEIIFWSTPNGVLTAHAEWLPGVWLMQFITTCSIQLCST